MSEKQLSDKTMKLIVVMGVSGCGKSSVARALAGHFDYEFVEADDFHPQENIDHMASGHSLTDEMREPWIQLLQAHLKQSAKSERSCVLSFSGLRRLHRAKIRDLPFASLFLHLEGDKELIKSRIEARADHFMPSSLLDSQYQTLEAASKKEHIVSIDISQTIEEVINSATTYTTQHFTNK